MNKWPTHTTNTINNKNSNQPYHREFDIRKGLTCHSLSKKRKKCANNPLTTMMTSFEIHPCKILFLLKYLTFKVYGKHWRKIIDYFILYTLWLLRFKSDKHYPFQAYFLSGVFHLCMCVNVLHLFTCLFVC